VALEQIIITAELTYSAAIDGIFHLAGITSDSMLIETMNKDMLEKILAPKIQGTLVLQELFKDKTLLCFILFSSVSAEPFSGINGLSAYATANGFMDGFAQYRQAHNQTALSISWTAFAEKGMSVQHRQEAFLAAIGVSMIKPAQGMEMLGYLAGTSLNQIIVQQIDWKKFFQVNAALKQNPYFENMLGETRVEVSQTFLSEDEILTKVASIFSQMMQLETDELDYQKPFQEYGLDSIGGVNFVLRLSEDFPDMITSTDLYRYVTIEQLATHLFTSQSAQIVTEVEKTILNESENEQQLEDEIISLSEAEALALLKKELDD
jgi:polyketide synthase PksL